MAGTDTLKPGQLLPTYSALQLAEEYMPECTDPLKIKNTASHIISGDHTVSYSIWYMAYFPGVKWLEREAGQKFYLLWS
jgi:hypothetical protein